MEHRLRGPSGSPSCVSPGERSWALTTAEPPRRRYQPKQLGTRETKEAAHSVATGRSSEPSLTRSTCALAGEGLQSTVKALLHVKKA